MADAAEMQDSSYDAEDSSSGSFASSNPRDEERALRLDAFRRASQVLAAWAEKRRTAIMLLLPDLSGRASKQAQADAVKLLQEISDEMNEAMIDPDSKLHKALRIAKQQKQMEDAHQVVLDGGALMADYHDDVQPYNSFRARDAVNKVQLALKRFLDKASK